MATSRELALKLTLETGEGTKAIKKLEDQIRKLGKESTKTSKIQQKNEKDLAKATEMRTKRQAKATQEVSKGRVQASKEVAKAEAEVRASIVKEQKASDAERGKLTEARISKEIELVKKQAKLERKILADRLKAVKGNAAKEIAIREKANKKALAGQKKLAAAENRLSKQKAKGSKKDSFLGIDRGDVENAENFATISKSIQEGDFAGAAAGIGGIKAGIAGIAADVLLDVGKALFKLGKEAQATNASFEKLAVAINIDARSASFASIQNQLLAIQRPAELSRKALADLAKQVGVFEAPEGIADTTKAILDLQRISGGDVGLDAITAGVGRLSAVMGSTGKEASDLLAVLSNELKGKAIDPLGEALTELGTATDKAGIIMRDAGQAAKESAILLSAFSSTGAMVSEATTRVEEVFLKMNDAINDDKVMDTISKRLPEGMSLMEAGFEDGNVSAVKFISVLEDMGDQGVDLANALGSTAGEGLAALLMQMDRSGGSISEIAARFDNAGDAASRFGRLTQVESERVAESNAQMAADFKDTFAGTFAGAVGAAEKALNNIFVFISSGGFSEGLRDVQDFFANLGPSLGPLGPALTGILGPLESIIDLFVDSQLQAQRALDAVDAVNAVTADMLGLVTELDQLEGPAFFTELEEALPLIANQAPGVATELEAIRDSVSLTEPEKIEQLKNALAEVSDVQAAKGIEATNAAVSALGESVKDLEEEAQGFARFLEDTLATGLRANFALITGGVSEYIGLGNVIEDVVAGTITSSFAEAEASAIESIDSIRAKQAELAGERDTAREGGDESAAIELERERLQLSLDLEASFQERDASRVGSAKLEEQSFAALQKVFELREKEFGVESALELVRAQAEETLGRQPEILANVIGKLEERAQAEEMQFNIINDSLALLQEQAHAEQNISDITQTQIEMAHESQALLESELESLLTGKDLEELKSQQEIRNVETKLKKQELLAVNLDAQVAQIDATIQAQVLSVNAENDRAKAAQQTARLLLEQKQILEGTKTSAPSSVVEIIAGGTLGELKALRDKTAAQASSIRSSIDSTRKELGGLKSGTKKAAGASKKATKSIKKDNKKREDAEKKLADALAKIAEERKKIEAERTKALEAIDDEREKAERDLTFNLQLAAIDRKEAEAELVKQLEAFSNKLKGNISDATDEALDSLNALAAKVDSAGDRLQKALDNLAVSQEQALQAFETQRKDTKTAKQTELKNAADFARQMRNVITEFGGQAFTANARLKEQFDNQIEAFKLGQKQTETVRGFNVKALLDLNELADLRANLIEISLKQIKKERERLRKTLENKKAALKLENLDRKKQKVKAGEASTAREKISPILRKMTAELAKQGGLVTKANVKALNDLASELGDMQVAFKKFTVVRSRDRKAQGAGVAQSIREKQATLTSGTDTSAILGFQGPKEGVTSGQIDRLEARLELADEGLDKATKKATKLADKYVEATKEAKRLDDQIKKIDATKDARLELALAQDIKEAGVAVSEIGVILTDQAAQLKDALGAGTAKEAEKIAKDAQKIVDPTQLKAWIKGVEDLFEQERFIKFYDDLKAKAKDTSKEVTQADRVETKNRLANIKVLEDELAKVIVAKDAISFKDKDFAAIGRANQTLLETQEALTLANSLFADQNKLMIDQLSHVEKEIKLQRENESLLQFRIGALEDLEKAGKPLTKQQKDELRFLKQAFTAEKALAKLRKQAAEDADKEEAQNELIRKLGVVAKVADTANSAIDGIADIAGNITLGDAAGTAESITNLTDEVGKALLAAPPPLSIVGAFMVAGAAIARVIQKIVTMIAGEQLTDLDRAEQRARQEEQILATQEARLSAMQSLVELGGLELDQAQEQLTVLREINAERAQSTNLGAQLAQMGEQQLVSFLELQKVQLAGIETQIAELEAKDRLDRNQKKDLEDLKTLQVDTNTAISAGNAELEGRLGIREAEIKFLEETIALEELKLRLGKDEQLVLMQTARLRKDALFGIIESTDGFTEALQSAGRAGLDVFQDSAKGALFGLLDMEKVAGLTAEQLKEVVLAMAEANGQEISSDEVMGLVNAWLDAEEALADFNETVAGSEDLFDKQRRMLEQLRDIGQDSEFEGITDEDFFERTLKLLRERLEVLEAEEQALKDAGASAGDVLDAEIARKDIELDILDLIREQNGELGNTDSILVDLIRKRQQLLKASRKDGTLTGAEADTLKAITDSAVARFIESNPNATEAEVQSFRDSLPSFAEGGAITHTGPAMVHGSQSKPEFILNAGAVESIGLRTLKQLNSMQFGNPFALGEMTSDRFLSALSGGGGQTQAGPINIDVAITINGAIAPAEAQVVGQNVGAGLISEIERAQNAGQLRRGR